MNTDGLSPLFEPHSRVGRPRERDRRARGPSSRQRRTPHLFQPIQPDQGEVHRVRSDEALDPPVHCFLCHLGFAPWLAETQYLTETVI